MLNFVLSLSFLFPLTFISLASLSLTSSLFILGQRTGKPVFMSKAFEQALLGFGKEEIPVGAVVVYENEIISAAHNESIHKTDPTSHAEIEAIRKAAKKMGNYRMPGAKMYVTLEPCLMCCGALIHARFDKAFA